MKFSEQAISARRYRIQRQSLLGERFGAPKFFRAEFGPSRNDGLIIRVSQCRIGVGVVGIQIDGTLEELACLVVAVTRIMGECIAAAQNVPVTAARFLVGFARTRSRSTRVRLTAASPTTRLAILSCTAKMSSPSTSYISDQTFRPVVGSETPTRTRLPARNGYCPRADNAHSAGANISRGAFEFLNWKLADFEIDEQVRKATKRGNDVFGGPVAEKIMAGIARQVLERQHRHRGTPCDASGCGEARHVDRLCHRALTRAGPSPAGVQRPRNKACRNNCGGPNSAN